MNALPPSWGKAVTQSKDIKRKYLIKIKKILLNILKMLNIYVSLFSK